MSNSRIESGKIYTEAVVTKFSAEAEEYLKNELRIAEPTLEDYRRYSISPEDRVEGPQPGNLLVNVGINQLWSRCATAEQVWDSTHGAIGVGNSSTAAAASQTDLQGGSKYFQAWAGTPTTGASQQIVFISTFGTAVANFAWDEYGVVVPDTGTTYTSGTSKQASYILLNRKAGAGLLGTKTSAQSWTLTITMTMV